MRCGEIARAKLLEPNEKKNSFAVGEAASVTDAVVAVTCEVA
jgi:hypothetical protein